MGFTKIEETDLIDIGVIGLPDRPGLSTAAMQNKLEETARSVIIPKFNNLIDEMGETDSAGNLGATPLTGRTSDPTVQAVLEKLSTDLKTVEDGMSEAIADAHTHANKTVLDKFGEESGVPTYDGSPMSSSWGSIGGTLSNQTDLKEALDAKANSADLAAVATTNSYNSLDNKPTIPDELADLSQDATHRTVTDTEKTTWDGKSVVSYTQTYTQAGQKIGEITINGTTTNVVAPTGGGGGGGDVNSVNGQTGTVELSLGDMMDANFQNLDDNHVPIYNSTDQEWNNAELSAVALSNDYEDLDNLPTIPAAQIQSDWNQSDNTKKDFIKNKPTIPAAQIQSDWNQSDTTAKDYIKNKPTQLGHHMIPNASLISTMAVAVTDITNDDVVSAYGVGTWSNVDAVQILTTVSADDDGVGTWEDEDDWETGSRTGWIIHSALHGILSDDDVEIEPIFKITGGSAVGLYAMRIDDAITGTTGGVALKFNAPVEASGYVGIRLKHLRTNTVTV